MNLQKELTAFLEWLSTRGWYEAAPGQYDNSRDPNKVVRLTAEEVVKEYLKSKKIQL